MAMTDKRKRGAGEPKFYAVREGRAPGIYHTWNDCLDQVKGHKGAIYKSFTSLTQAEAFLTSTGPIPASGPPKFYAVRHGHEPGIYSDWHTAQKQITGYQKPQHKKFSTRAEAEAYLRRPSPTIETVRPAVADADAARATSRVKNEDAEDEEAPAAKRRTATRLTAGEADAAAAAAADMLLPLGWAAPPADAADGHDYTLTIDAASGQLRRKTAAELDALTVRPANAGPAAAAATSSKTANRGGPLNVWTDGACRANGQRGAIAGVGVYFGPRDPNNISEPLPGPRQTNQRAELTAIKRALDTVPLDRDTTIHSDSAYAIKCATEWGPRWAASGWTTAGRKPVENRDLVEELLWRLAARERCGARTRFKWVKAHAEEEGNVQADRLAVQGALAARAGG